MRAAAYLARRIQTAIFAAPDTVVAGKVYDGVVVLVRVAVVQKILGLRSEHVEGAIEINIQGIMLHQELIISKLVRPVKPS